MPAVKDVYVNQAFLSVTESALNTLTFGKLETGIAIFEKAAWLICRIDYEFIISAAQFGAEADNLVFGISVSDQITNTDLSNSAIVDRNRVTRMDFGTAASGVILRSPYTKNFASLPGNGLLIPPNPIYIFAAGTALTGPVTLEARMFYTVIKLAGDEFWELVEQRRMIGA